MSVRAEPNAARGRLLERTATAVLERALAGLEDGTLEVELPGGSVRRCDAGQARLRGVVHGGGVGLRRSCRALRAAPAERRRGCGAPRARAPVPRAAAAARAAEWLRAFAPQHRLPLRPRQRALRADARRDDDVLVRRLFRSGHDPRRGTA